MNVHPKDIVSRLKQHFVHLKKIVKFIENKSDIEILAIGIGHDVSRYYKKAIKIIELMAQEFKILGEYKHKKS